MNRRVLAFVLVVAVPTPLLAQNESARDAMTRGIRAYQDLDLDVASTLLRGALSKEGRGELDDSARVEALMYLGAAEFYRASRDSAVAVFHRLVLLAPRHRPDSLVFAPEITRLYNQVQQSLQTVSIETTRPTPTPAPATATATPPGERTQHRISATGAGTLVNVEAQSEVGGLPPASGTVLGMSASVRYDRFEVGVRYMQGWLQNRHLAEGAAALRFVTTPWLTLHTGPQIRRYETPAGAERWVTWQLGARAEAPIVATSVRGHAMWWGGPVLSVNVPPLVSGTTLGGELGVTVDMTRGPFWFGMTYGIDQASVRGTTRRETVKTLTITAGLRRP